VVAAADAMPSTPRSGDESVADCSGERLVVGVPLCQLMQQLQRRGLILGRNCRPCSGDRNREPTRNRARGQGGR